jgi:hypothetical protein
MVRSSRRRGRDEGGEQANLIDTMSRKLADETYNLSGSCRGVLWPRGCSAAFHAHG